MAVERNALRIEARAELIDLLGLFEINSCGLAGLVCRFDRLSLLLSYLYSLLLWVVFVGKTVII